ncbi:hypothetical protein B0H17DRAFT_396493 [Mycena rosella]|uniref:Fungal STAND N-terminal Goodbye domain-containing protein n=1 Tax=Mycena rosella TaxID=1033263 RepID=A0AAD7CN93_MYCRO|nr:hypothetical protein B0H17DRAFT_396493 [Mycena rosella]
MVTPNEFDALWNDALQKYGSETGSDLLQSDYAQLFDDCDSVDTVVDALEQEMEAFKKFRSDDSKWATLRNKLKPVVHFVLLFNDATAEAAASHAPGGKSILVAFGVLLTVSVSVMTLSLSCSKSSAAFSAALESASMYPRASDLFRRPSLSTSSFTCFMFSLCRPS